MDVVHGCVVGIDETVEGEVGLIHRRCVVGLDVVAVDIAWFLQDAHGAQPFVGAGVGADCKHLSICGAEAGNDGAGSVEGDL